MQLKRTISKVSRYGSMATIAVAMMSQSAVAQMVLPSVAPTPGAAISASRTKALLLYKRLNGVAIPVDSPRLVEMETLINQGNMRGAARVAMQDPTFLNIVVKDFAAKMSTREESVKAPLSDFIATVVGVTRDDVNAKELLTGNFLYEGDPSKVTNLPVNVLTDILGTNRHYDTLRTSNADLSQVLIRVDGQRAAAPNGAVVAHPDPAGILTSRAFMQAHAIDGTNRRLVEYAFREFLCIATEDFADASLSDNFVGRDVSRFPGGDNRVYETSCKTCHAPMDALRGAFARVDYDERNIAIAVNGANVNHNFVKYTSLWPNGNTTATQVQHSPQAAGVVLKMNHNLDHDSAYVVADTRFENYLTRGNNAEFFGWRSPNSGSGIKEFGSLLANSKAFPRCMAKRVYEASCKRSPASFDKALIQQAADEFENGGYKLKTLFEIISASDSCLGK